MKKNVVTQAIKHMGSEGQEWLEGIYRKISSEGKTGSYLPMSPKEVEETLLTADWQIETVNS